ncbi:MAG TPA: polysaccharide pyruvyl transferase family protein [Acidimicrobiales bacterium]|nr:polysaccharide pyruvyl transferase family protein [Acidimicrobiales bacterium]
MTDTAPTSSKPRVGVVGFIGWGNFGDELFMLVHRQFLSADFDVDLLHDRFEKPYFSRPVAEVVDEVDAVVIGGGDLVIPWQLSELYWRRELLERPVFLTGIGVPRWGGYSRAVVDTMKEFIQHPNVRYIGVRDEPSRDWVQRHLQPKIEIDCAPDIVCSLDLPAVQPTDERILGVVTRKRRNEGDDFLWLERLCEKAARLDYRIHHLVLGTGGTGAADEAVEAEFRFPGKQTVRTDDLLELCRAVGRCTALASMKFHGSVVAAMYGVPSLVLSPTDKNRNFMNMIDRPELLSNLSDPHLPDRFSPYLPRIPRQTRDWLRETSTAAMLRLVESIRQEVGAVRPHRVH